ncbi:AAA family ATPase [Vibrio maerlii]|uniref:AAA family ATPase n=1 Tax=Vibrio maerlii TaxID=2231648 RepID=UPI000E3EE50A|nr:AAA family ATPase [Vibrio maerlii]
MNTTKEGRHRDTLSPQALAPQVPTSFFELGIPRTVVENLLIKHLAAYPKSDVLQLTKLMAINSHLVEEMLADLRRKSHIEVFSANEVNSYAAVTQQGGVRYSLSQSGLEEADNAFKEDPYLGPTPISLKDYEKMVNAQDVRNRVVTKPEVEHALEDVLGSERLISMIGPAINSGRALMLYGDAGTGKTFVATKLLRSLNTSVYIPYAVFASGNVIRVFSAQHHEKVQENERQGSHIYKDKYDPRWVLCERPSVQVGGELTMDMLEVNHSQHNKVWMAPLQMMANNGIFIIDDLGRQSMSVDTLLNRWIVPMEYFEDFLSLPNGQQVTVPFVLTLAFSTNLDPEKISDPAFLRRIGYKIQFQPLTKAEYHQLWHIVASSKNLELTTPTLEKLFELHRQDDINFYPCLPKDMVGISRDIIVFEEYDAVITPEIVERAWSVYFTAEGNGGGKR